MEHTYRLLTSSPDCVGIVADVSDYIRQHQGWLVEASYHSDRDNNRFFMRNEILASSLVGSLENFKEGFAKIANRFNMTWQLIDSQKPKRVAFFASHESHCLSDLLNRYQSGELDCDLVSVISNHRNLEPLVTHYGIPFHHVPVDPDNKAEHFQKIEALLDQEQIEAIVLAKYMQIIPAWMTDRFENRMINIHHSFLPSFVGANPYGQAFHRGVKLIGATCHYVTQQLDEGPIIEQDVERVSHRESKADLVRLGRDIERSVLAKGLRLHLQDRIMVWQNKTVIFN